VVLETNRSGLAIASYVLGGTELLSQTRNNATSYYLHDEQGSTRALTNSSGFDSSFRFFHAYIIIV